MQRNACNKELDISEVLFDILMLEARGLWMAGEEERARFCGDALEREKEAFLNGCALRLKALSESRCFTL